MCFVVLEQCCTSCPRLPRLANCVAVQIFLQHTAKSCMQSRMRITCHNMRQDKPHCQLTSPHNSKDEAHKEQWSKMWQVVRQDWRGWIPMKKDVVKGASARRRECCVFGSPMDCRTGDVFQCWMLVVEERLGEMCVPCCSMSFSVWPGLPGSTSSRRSSLCPPSVQVSCTLANWHPIIQLQFTASCSIRLYNFGKN